MGKTRYYYNTKTCQYEVLRITPLGVIRYFTAILLMSGLLFLAMVVATDRWFITPEEKSLRAENKALESHQATLVAQLSAIESDLEKLHDLDKTIHEKLFEEPLDISQSMNGSSFEKGKILTADEKTFTQTLSQVGDLTAQLKDKSQKINQLFGQHFNLAKEDIESIKSIPTLQPVKNPKMDLIVSGYGERINPFHKGKYKHPGIDFAAPRGTPVYATAKGKVKLISHTSLKAGYGNYIEISHGDGLVTRYAHLNKIKVKHGEKIEKGTIIGTVGSTGGSVAPHLHYEILEQGEPIDPLTYMVQGLTSEQFEELLKINNKQNQSLD